MNLSKTGVIADILWNTMRQHHKFVELGDFVVMPNHIYGILILDKPDGDLPMQPPKNVKMAAISPKPNSVSTIIRSYKSAVTKHANRLGFLMVGRHVFMITLSGMMRNISVSRII